MMVADSDVLIDFLEGRAPAANRVALELDRGQLRTTVITRFELLAGARTARQLKHVGELLAALPCLPLDEPAADAAAEDPSNPGTRRRGHRHGRQPHRRDRGDPPRHPPDPEPTPFERVPGLPLGPMGRTEGD